MKYLTFGMHNNLYSLLHDRLESIEITDCKFHDVVHPIYICLLPLLKEYTLSFTRSEGHRFFSSGPSKEEMANTK